MVPSDSSLYSDFDRHQTAPSEASQTIAKYALFFDAAIVSVNGLPVFFPPGPSLLFKQHLSQASLQGL
jgi:hypothetical protein